MKTRELFEAFFYPLIRLNEIVRTSDELGELVVYEFQDCRVLTFGSIFEQSRMRLHQPLQLEHEYTQAMLLPLLFQQPLQHITLLGLGAGVLASYLFHAIESATLTVVEWREAVIDIAFEYFALPVDERLDVIHDDAGQFIAAAAPESTDWILSDLFTASDMSAVQLQADFYRDCFTALRVDGWLVLNFHGQPSIECPAIRSLCAQFPAVFMVTVASGNRVVMASKNSVSWPTKVQLFSENFLSETFPVGLSETLTRLSTRVVSLR